MDLVHCNDWTPIEDLWKTIHPENASWQRWLHTVVRNHLRRQMQDVLQYVTQADAEYSTRFKTLLLDLKPAIYLLPKDFLLLRPGSIYVAYVKDVYRLDEKSRQHLLMGGVLGGFDVTVFAGHESTISHLYDALTATQTRTDWTAISVHDANTIAHNWVKELNRRALEGGGKSQVVFNYHTVEPPVIPVEQLPPSADERLTLSGSIFKSTDSIKEQPTRIKHDWQVHLLLDEQAYKSEGYYMSHCVASYWNNNPVKSNSIYSVRCDGQRKATVEIQHNGLGSSKCVQIKAHSNKIPDDLTLMVINQWFESAKIVDMTNTNKNSTNQVSDYAHHFMEVQRDRDRSQPLYRGGRYHIHRDPRTHQLYIQGPDGGRVNVDEAQVQGRPTAMVYREMIAQMDEEAKRNRELRLNDGLIGTNTGRMVIMDEADASITNVDRCITRSI